MTAKLSPYARRDYGAALAASLGGCHAALPIAAWDGATVVLRPVPGARCRDAMGPYPLLPFAADWSIQAGLEEVAAAGTVSLVVVSDPLSPPADVGPFSHVRPFKRHHLVRGGPRHYQPHAHHRRAIRRAARRCEVAGIAFDDAIEDWLRLYGALAARRGFVGALQDFGRPYLMALPRLGLRAFAAREAGRVVAMGLWLVDGDRAWYHLGAADEAGRACGAGHAVFDVAIRALLDAGVTDIVLGGGLHAASDPSCGLDRFKAGFANEARVNMILGAVLDPGRYAALGAGADWFPAYRAPAASAARAA